MSIERRLIHVHVNFIRNTYNRCKLCSVFCMSTEICLLYINIIMLYYKSHNKFLKNMLTNALKYYAYEININRVIRLNLAIG